MFSGEEIARMSAEAAEEAAEQDLTPYVPWDRDEVEAYGVTRGVPFPNLGDYRPEGWELIEHRMVDATGWGDESEPALTVRGLREWVIANMGASDGYGIIEQGQFQVVVGRFANRRLHPVH